MLKEVLWSQIETIIYAADIPVLDETITPVRNSWFNCGNNAGREAPQYTQKFHANPAPGRVRNCSQLHQPFIIIMLPCDRLLSAAASHGHACACARRVGVAYGCGKTWLVSRPSQFAPMTHASAWAGFSAHAHAITTNIPPY